MSDIDTLIQTMRGWANGGSDMLASSLREGNYQGWLREGADALERLQGDLAAAEQVIEATRDHSCGLTRSSS